MKCLIGVLVLACVAAANAHYWGPVIEVAKPHSPVGSHGPALVNLFSHNSWGGYGGYSGYGGLGGYGGGDGGYGGGAGGGAGGGSSGAVGGASNEGGGGAGYGYSGYGYDHGHNGKYVASNRGAIHIAPLLGHIQSVKSTNEQPAPGSTW